MMHAGAGISASDALPAAVAENYPFGMTIFSIITGKNAPVMANGKPNFCTAQK